MNTQVRAAPSALKLGVISAACCALAGFGQLGGWMVARMSPLSLNIPEAAPPAPWRFAPVDPRTAQRLNAAQPIVPGLTPAVPFVLTGDAGDRARALTCLTQAVYYEAASQSEQGQRAVAQVVLNRVHHPLFPHSICGVVYQGANLDAGCQFSFVCDGSMDRPRAAWAWTAAETVARGALAGQVEGAVGQATYYHADYVAPYWAPTVDKVAQIGAHIFYRWTGALGLPSAFSARYTGVEVVPVVKPHAPADPQLLVAVASAPQITVAEEVLQTPGAAPAGATSALQRVHLVLDADGYAAVRGEAPRLAAPPPAADKLPAPAGPAEAGSEATPASAPTAAASTAAPAV